MGKSGRGKPNEFIHDICYIEECENRGMKNDMTSVNQSFFTTKIDDDGDGDGDDDENNDNNNRKEILLNIESVLIVEEIDEDDWTSQTITHYDDKAQQVLCNTLCETQSFDEFLKASKEALENGLFLARNVTSYVGGTD